MPFPKSEQEWADRVRSYLKARLRERGVGYAELAEKMKKLGFEETVPAITNKLKRGTFSATFFLAALAAIGVNEVRIRDV